MKNFSVELDKPYCGMRKVSYDAKNEILTCINENGTHNTQAKTWEECKPLLDATLRNVERLGFKATYLEF